MHRRRCGVLAHLSSLPGPHGIGDLEATSHDWLDWLSSAGASVWQLLPLGPTGFGDSPYSALSSFAGNPLLIDLEPLVESDLLESNEIEQRAIATPGPVDFPAVRRAKEGLLRRAWSRIRDSAGTFGGGDALREAIEAFRRGSEQAAWLEDWVLYAALKSSHENAAWLDWPEEIRRREPSALAAARHQMADEIDYRIFEQFLFSSQWKRLRRRAAQLGIELWGDLPFYPALDSADVWSRQELFELDPSGRPILVAGVPPDAFTDSGQLWGNPVYRWRRMRRRDYDWWVDRLEAAVERFDRVRLDHFRGYAAYWVVPAPADTAAHGRWVAGPGARPFRAARERLGELPLLAEDLGRITPAVDRLRRRLDLPGTRVLQFAFDDPQSVHLPHRLPTAVAAYTATHDNAPTRAWLAALGTERARRVLAYTGGTAETVHWDLLRSAMVSSAADAVVPLQDLLGLGASARLNRPGERSGQWGWRLDEPPAAEPAERLRHLASITGRLAGVVAETGDEATELTDG